MPLRTVPSRAKGVSIHYRVLMKGHERIKITQFTLSLLSQICEFAKARKCNRSQPLEVIVLAKKILSQNSAVSVSYFL